jgi:hypothetical protein
VGKPLLATTIDDTFKDKKDTFVFLIDTEGAELKIMKIILINILTIELVGKTKLTLG